MSRDLPAMERRIADAAGSLTWRGLTAERRRRFRRSVLDYAGCVIGSAEREELRPALMLARPGEVAVPGIGRGFDPASAALVLGTAGALFQLHDIYAPGGLHPGTAVISAAWAIWRARKRPTTDFLRAVAAGYEVTNRLAGTTFPAQQLAGFTPTATMGTIGAAVAAGLLLGLDAEALATAIGNATILCPMTPFQTLCTHGSAVPIHGGVAARAGVEAALMAADGWSAGLHSLEGGAGLPGWLGALGADPLQILPETWDGGSIDQVIWKLFPSCGASQPAVEAALRTPAFDADAIKSVEIRIPRNSMLLVGGGPRPVRELYDRLMSVRWAVARALLDRRFGVETLARPDDSRVDALIERSQVVHDTSLDPTPVARSEVAAGLRIELRDGAVHEFVHRRPRLGPFDDGKPRGWLSAIDDAVLDAKFAALTARHAEVATAIRAEILAPDCA